MTSNITFEQQGVTDDEVDIVRLSKNDFDRVSFGEVIADAEISKAINEMKKLFLL